MLDKMWYEWQLRDPSNKNAFAGGSFSVQVNRSVPFTGGPPLLNVRGNPPPCRVPVVMALTPPTVDLSDSWRWLVGKCHDPGRYGHGGRKALLHLRLMYSSSLPWTFTNKLL